MRIKTTENGIFSKKIILAKLGNAVVILDSKLEEISGGYSNVAKNSKKLRLTFM